MAQQSSMKISVMEFQVAGLLRGYGQQRRLVCLLGRAMVAQPPTLESLQVAPSTITVLRLGHCQHLQSRSMNMSETSCCHSVAQLKLKI